MPEYEASLTAIKQFFCPRSVCALSFHDVTGSTQFTVMEKRTTYTLGPAKPWARATTVFEV
ncbi:hypothetical protein ACFL47_07665 [Candidatus Latescibacterota bacterium]